MAFTYSRSNNNERRPDHAKKRPASRAQNIARTQERRKVFDLTPMQLEDFCQTSDAFPDDDLDPSSDIEEVLIDDEAFDTEIDTNDPDDLESSQEQDFIYDASGTVDAETKQAEHAILDLQNCYRLCVVPRENGPWQCRFQAPSWMYNYKKQQGDPLPDLIDTLNTLADWLEHEKQAFLRDPSPENYALSPCGNHEESAVTQKGLQSILNKWYEYKKHEKGEIIKKDDFSRLKNKIWIFWPDFCFSIETLFSKDFRFSWVLARCEEKASIATWRKSKINFEKIPKEIKKKLKEQSPETWNLSQTLGMLCQAFDSPIDAKKIYKALLEKGESNV